MIQDMSFPRNDPSLLSVNAAIDSDDFPTEWGTFDTTAELILSLPAGCLAAAFDITAAYRTTPVHPDEQHLLCIFWKGKVYVDRAVAFGLASSAGVFGSVADMFIAIYRAHDFIVIKWVDDFLAIRLPHQSWSEQDFINLTAPLGVPWSASKTRPLAEQQRYIGFVWDLRDRSVSLPDEKLQATLALLNQWLEPSVKFTMKESASLHGKLVHISSIFRIIRPFLRSLSHFASRFASHRAKLFPPKTVIADLKWAQMLIDSTPNLRPLLAFKPLDIGWWGDASTSFGVGVVVGEYWAAWKWAPHVSIGPGKRFDIGWAEAVAVELGLRLALQRRPTPDQGSSPWCRGGNLLVRSDNAGVVAVVNKGRSRSSDTNDVLKELHLLLARHALSLTAQHVASEDNISDALSRGDLQGFSRRFPTACTKVLLLLPPHLEDKLISV